MTITQQDLENYKQEIRSYEAAHGMDDTFWKMIHQQIKMERELILQPIRENTGKYISLGGKPNSKQCIYKIIGINEDGDIRLKRYRGKSVLLLPSYNVETESKYWHILTDEEFNQLPEKLAINRI